MSDIHEKEALALSEMAAAEEEATVVKEAFAPGYGAAAEMPAMDYAKDPPEQQGENEAEAGGPRAWMQTQRPQDFLPFLLHEFKRIEPGIRARGKSEIERALGQLKRLNNLVSKALQGDYDGEIDIAQVEPLRQRIEDAMDRLQANLDAMAEMAKKRKQMMRGPNRRRGSDEQLCSDCGTVLWREGSEASCLVCDGLVKEATTPRYQGLQYQISGFERAIIGTLINGKVSGGRNIEDLYDKLRKKYSITDREELAIIQAMADMGYPEFLDRAKIGEPVDPSDEENIGEWQAQYYA